MASSIKPRAIICEDEPDVRHIMELILVGDGFDVYAQGTLKDLEDRLKRLKPDLLILDVMLPGGAMDGMDMCRKIKEEGAYPKMKILICSAIARGTTQTEANLSQISKADDFLFKPFEPNDLRKRVAALVKR